EGKLRDPAWMADFASLHLLDHAFTWYFRLSPEVQQDWPQLQAALFEKWIPPGCDEPRGVPTAADSPYEELDHRQSAILKVAEAGKQEVRYVTRARNGKGFSLTSNAEEALRFRFDPHFAELTAVDCEALKSPVGRSGPFQIATFTIAKTGEVTPLWRDGTTERSLKAFTNTTPSVLLVPDAEAFHKHYSAEVPATLFIEKVD
ncbi:hypothetical protein FRC00_005137, partial [Tulasnella sp. 408]